MPIYGQFFIYFTLSLEWISVLLAIAQLRLDSEELVIRYLDIQ